MNVNNQLILNVIFVVNFFSVKIKSTMMKSQNKLITKNKNRGIVKILHGTFNNYFPVFYLTMIFGLKKSFKKIQTKILKKFEKIDQNNFKTRIEVL